MDKINVDLYSGKGIFGGREIPMVAVETYCDVYDKCSYYKSGKCLNVRNFLGNNCKFGKVSVIKGYTSRAKKYYEFKSNYEKDEVYHKLSYPKQRTAVINGNFYVDLVYVCVREKKETDDYGKVVGNYIVFNDLFENKASFIRLNELTNILLYVIFSYKPHALVGGVIEDYQKKIVPEVLQELKRLMPHTYDCFVSEYPEYNFEPNYIGKKAYISSLKPNTKFMYKGREWLYDGEYVSTSNYDVRSASPWYLSNGAHHTDVRFKVNDNMIFEVQDNSIVDENTRFE